MTKSIPKHLLEKFALLYYGTNGQDFTHEEAQMILKISRSYAGQVLPILLKNGWITTKRIDTDRRRKIYSFVEPTKIIEDLGRNLAEE